MWANAQRDDRLPNIGGALCSTPQGRKVSLTPSTRGVQQRCQDAKPAEVSWGAPN